MYWILAAIFIVIALAVPRLRPLGVVGCVVLGALLAWGMLQRVREDAPRTTQDSDRRGAPTSPAAVLQPVPLDAVAAEDLRLSGAGAPFELKGRVSNDTQDLLLRSVTLHVVRRDCYEGALDPSGCVILWQDRPWVPLSIPPGEAREFAISIWMRGAAGRPRGRVQDSFEVIAATGAPAAKPRRRE